MTSTETLGDTLTLEAASIGGIKETSIDLSSD